MREMIVTELTQATQELSRGFAHILPRIIVLLIITLVGWIVASLLKMLLQSILRLVKFDKLAENAGTAHLLVKAGLPSATDLVTRFVFGVAWLGFILLGVSDLGVFGLQEQIARFFLFLPRVFAAIFIMFVGLLGANFLSRATLLAAVNSNFPSPRLLGISVRTIIIIFVLSMTCEELGIAEQTMLVAFSIAFGAMMLGLAIAFGIGGRNLAQHFLEKRFLHHATKDDEEGKKDELSPL